MKQTTLLQQLIDRYLEVFFFKPAYLGAICMLLLTNNVHGRSHNEGREKATEKTGAVNQKAFGIRALSFLENKGQVTDQYKNARQDIQFHLQAANGLSVFIGSGAIHYQFSKCTGGTQPPNSPPLHHERQKLLPSVYTMYRMDVELVGANKNARVITEELQDYYEHFITPAFDKNGGTAHTWNRIIYKDVYPGIDWVLYVSGTQLKHEFLVREGGKVSDIRLKYGGATQLKINDDGTFTAGTPQGTITENAPSTYQQDGGKVASSFSLNGNILSYKVAAYSGALTIDPSLNWATYYGGAASDFAWYVTADNSGNLYMSGVTSSTSAIATTGAYQTTDTSSQNNAFLVKFNSSGARQWATYFGGDKYETGNALAIDNAGDIYMAGHSKSPGIATAGAFQTTNDNTTNGNAYLAKFSSSGACLWATYYGGNRGDDAYGIAVDVSGNIYMTGNSYSSGLATTGAFQTVNNDTNTTHSFGNGYLVKFNSSGARQWATYYGGTGQDYGTGVAADTAGNAYIYMQTTSRGLATTGAYQTTNRGSMNVLLAKFDSTGARQWATYFGGTSGENTPYTAGIAIDRSGNLFITGTATSTGLATSGAYNTANPGADAFLTKFNSSGALKWCTYFGAGDEQGSNVAIDTLGNVYLVGIATRNGLATTGAYQTTCKNAGTGNAFLARFDSTGSHLRYATYYGNTSGANGFGVASSGMNVYLAGQTYDTIGIATSGSFQSVYGGGGDAFLANFSFDDVAFSGGSLQSLSVCENSGTTAINSLLQVSDSLVGITETYSVTVSPLHGSITTGGTAQSTAGSVSPTGWSYTPNTGFIGADSFNVQVNNGTTTVTTSIKIIVNPVPSFSGTSGAAICAGNSTTLIASTATAGNALTFPGTTASYVSIPDSASTRLTSGSFTVSAWIYPTLSTHQMILLHGMGCANWASWFLAIGGAESVTAANKIVFGFRTSNVSGTLREIAAPSNVTLNTWTQITGTYDGANLNLYINGQLAGTLATSGTPYSSTDNLFIGGDAGCGGRNVFNGSIDDVQLWNIARSAAAINSDYYMHKPSSTPGLVGSWSFDEASGTSITDSVGGVNGTIINSVTRLIPSTAPIGDVASRNYTWSPSTGLSATTGALVTALPGASTTYTITATGIGGCVNTATQTVTVNALPTLRTGSDTAICSGFSATISCIGGVTYTWLPSTGLTATTGASLSANPASSTSYTVTGIDVNGCVNTATQAVTVNPLPSISAGSNVAVCLGSSATLSSSGGLTYTWSPSTGLTATTGSSLSASPAASTTYTVTGTGVNGCVNTASQAVTVNPLPPVSAGTAVTVCAGTPATLSGSGGVTYTWSPSTGLSTTTGASLSANPASSTTYTVTGFDGNGCSATATQAVSVNPLPSVSAGSSVAVCSGSSATLSAGGGATYTWSPSAGLSATTGNSITATPGSSVTYTVVGTNLNGCVKTATQTITVNPIPAAVSVSGGGLSCGSAILNATGGAGGTIYFEGITTGGISTAIPASSQSVTSSGIYYFRSGSGGCWGTQGSTTVSINPAPAAYSVTGGGPICTGSTGITVGLSASDAGIHYQLCRGLTPLSTITGTGSLISYGLQSAAGTYSVVATNTTSGCAATMSGSATITLSPATAPAIVSVTGGGGYCSGGTGVNIGVAGSAVGINYQLYYGTMAIGGPMPGIGSSLNFGLQTAAGGYTVTATNPSNSCTNSMSGTATVSVYTVPAVYTVTGGGSYCTGGYGVHIGLSGSNTGVSYKVYRSGTPTTSILTGTGAALDFGLFTTAGTYTIMATGLSYGCVTEMSGSVTVTINSLPLISGLTSVSAGGTISLTGTPSGGTWASIYPSLATVGSSSGVVTGISAGTGVISYADPAGCAALFTIKITGSAHRGSTASQNQAFESSDENITLSPNPNNGTFRVTGTLNSSDDQEVSFSVINMAGQQVYSENQVATGGIIDKVVSLKNNLPNGIYQLMLSSAAENKAIRIVINR